MNEQIERALAVAAAEQILGGRKLHPLMRKVARERLGLEIGVIDQELERAFLAALADVLDEREGGFL